MAVSGSGRFCHPNKYFSVQGGEGEGGGRGGVDGLENPHGTFLSSSHTVWLICTSTKWERGIRNNADADWLAKNCYFFALKKGTFIFVSSVVCFFSFV